MCDKVTFFVKTNKQNKNKKHKYYNMRGHGNTDNNIF